MISTTSPQSNKVFDGTLEILKQVRDDFIPVLCALSLNSEADNLTTTTTRPND